MSYYDCFVHKDCEYYPCHQQEKTGGEEEWNCLFCYCPLYLMESCIGNPQYIVNGKGQLIKDCSQCLVPHKRENYGKILEAFYQRDQVISLKIEEISYEILERMTDICHWNVVDGQTQYEQKVQVKNLLEENFLSQKVEILLQDFDRQCIQKGYFQFGKEIIPCQVLERLSREKIEKGYFYVFHAPEWNVASEETFSLMEQYYIEGIQIAILDCVRDWIQQMLQRKHSVYSQRYVTDSFGPGFYGMPIESLSQLFSIISGEKAGVTLEENGNMKPLKSCVGIFLVGKKPFQKQLTDCAGCMGNSNGCRLCRTGKSLK